MYIVVMQLIGGMLHIYAPGKVLNSQFGSNNP